MSKKHYQRGNPGLNPVRKELETIIGMGYRSHRVFEDWVGLMFHAFQRDDPPYLEIMGGYRNTAPRGQREADHFATATACLLGLDREEVLRVLSTLHPVSGRFEILRAANGTSAVVDYAHTPDALENVLRTIEEIRTPAQQLIVVCGCGGDRDRTKRPEMAQIAVRYATTAIFTSDNPRHESPEAILDEMIAGLDPSARYLRIADRAEAIRTAVMLARPGDVILVAGKGHETYQIIGDVKHHFDDREEVRKAFAALTAH